MGLSIRAYAQHRGCSKSAVMKAVKEGRITRTPDGKIDPATADAEWITNSDPSQVTAQNNGRTYTTNAEPSRKEIKEAAIESSMGDGPTYIQSRAIRELYVARLRKLEYEEKAGRVVSLDKVSVRWFNLSRQLRDQLISIPNRIDALLAAETDRFTINHMLTAEISRVLEEFSKSDPNKL